MRAVRVELSLTLIKQVLGLPESAEVLFIHQDDMLRLKRTAIALVQHPDLPKVPEACKPPLASPQVQYTFDEYGHVIEKEITDWGIE